MIDKELLYIYGDHNSEVFSLVHEDTLEKRAGYSEELKSYIDTLKEERGKVYALINALSAGEYYGSNRNGDYFPEEALKKYHKTFESLGHVYKHHVNKDPQKSLGKVVFSHYNDKMHRVEIIVALDSEKAKDVIDDYKKGKLVATSMGSRVPFDVCSICQNKAKSRAEYCTHLKNQLNQILPGGKQVYAINTMPKFFDISIVLIPADKTSSILKLFDKEGTKKSVEKVAFYDNNEYIIKTAGMIKEVPSENIELVSIKKDPKKLVKRFSKEKIEKLANENFEEVLSTFLGLRIVPHPADFQKLALYASNQKDLADKLDYNNIVFTQEEPIELELDLDNFNEKIAEYLQDDILEMSLTKPLFVTRELCKVAQVASVDPSIQSPAPEVQQATNWQEPQERSIINKVLFDYTPDPKKTAVKSPIVPLGILGGLYYGYTKLFNTVPSNKFTRMLREYPWLIPVLVGGASLASTTLQKNNFQKHAGMDRLFTSALIGFPTSYYLAGKAENKAQMGEPISGVENFIRKHPALTGILGTLGISKVRKTLFPKVANFVNRLPEEKVNEIYNNLTGGE